MDEAYFDSSYGIDWDDLWRQQLQAASFRTLGADRWNAGAANWGKAMDGSSNSNYVEQLLARMNLSSDMTVLDVGCGSGRLAIPLGQASSSCNRPRPGPCDVGVNRSPRDRPARAERGA